MKIKKSGFGKEAKVTIDTIIKFGRKCLKMSEVKI